MIPYQEGELEWHERRRWRSWKLRTQSQLLSEPEIRIFIPNWPGEKGKKKYPSFNIQFPQGLLVWGSHRADAFEERTGEEYREECSTKQPQDQEDLGAHVSKISIFVRFVCPQMKTPRQRVWSWKWRWCLCRGWWTWHNKGESKTLVHQAWFFLLHQDLFWQELYSISLNWYLRWNFFDDDMVSV